MKALTEAAVLRACLQYLALRGIWSWRNNTGATRGTSADGRSRLIRFGAVGSGDIFGVLPAGKEYSAGRFLSVECKRPGGKPTAAQTAWMARVTAAGGLALLVESVQDLERGLREAGY